MSSTKIELASFRDVPHACHCDWTVRCTNPGAVWVLSHVHPSCPVHGTISPDPSPAR
jgi:hypothetical protein